MYDRFISLLIILVTWFVIPSLVLQVIDSPRDYWNWVFLVAWVYVLISEAIRLNSITRAKEEEK